MDLRVQSHRFSAVLFFNNWEGKSSIGLDESLMGVGLSCILFAREVKRRVRMAQTRL